MATCSAQRLTLDFFNRDCAAVAKDLLGKVIRVRYGKLTLPVKIIETEAYYMHEKASHASLGFTQKRKALFMPAGTIYMYYSRGGDSLNVSCKGDGNAVLIKSGIPYQDELSDRVINKMQQLNPKPSGQVRQIEKLCSGQTLLCRSLGLKVPDWDQLQFNDDFYIADLGYQPVSIFCTPRLGIPAGRDEHLMLRFVDSKYHQYSSKKVLQSTCHQVVTCL